MAFGNSMFGDFDIKSMMASDTNMFTDTDVKTILGRNIVKNYLSKIDFEIKTFGYSESSIEIIEFYEECKKKGGIVEFISNPVIKMILDEIENMRTVKYYLKDRIFDDIEDEKSKSLDDLFNNNEEITEKINQEKQNYMLEKEIRRKEIIKIQKRYNCSFEEAENIYEAHKRQLSICKQGNNMVNEMKSVFNMLEDFGIVEEKPQKTKLKIDTTQEIPNGNTSEIDLQDSIDEDDSNIDDGFWS